MGKEELKELQAIKKLLVLIARKNETKLVEIGNLLDTNESTIRSWLKASKKKK